MTQYYVVIMKKSSSSSKDEIINKVGYFDSLPLARKASIKYIKTSKIYYAKIYKDLLTRGLELGESVRYNPDTESYVTNDKKTINTKTGEVVRKTVKPVARNPNILGPIKARYYACYDGDGYKPEFWADNLNDLRKRVLRYSSHTFMDVYDTKLQKYVGIIEVLQRCWRTPSDNWYHIKEDGSVGNRTTKPSWY